MKQKGGKFESNYKMSHLSNINGSITSNKIIANGNDSGINIITQKNNNKPEHIFINLEQFVNKLDRGEKDLFYKLDKLMKDENHNHPLILQKPLNKLKIRRGRKASKGKVSSTNKKKKRRRKTNRRWKKKNQKTLKKKQASLFDVF